MGTFSCPNDDGGVCPTDSEDAGRAVSGWDSVNLDELPEDIRRRAESLESMGTMVVELAPMGSEAALGKIIRCSCGDLYMSES